MQTREGSEWNQAFQEALNRLLNDAGKLASERSQLLKTHCSDILKKVKLLHGESKEARKFDLHFGGEPPPTGGTAVPVWIRDGWEVEEKTVVDEARPRATRPPWSTASSPANTPRNSSGPSPATTPPPRRSRPRARRVRRRASRRARRWRRGRNRHSGRATT